MGKEYRIEAKVDYVTGYLRTGHFELFLNEESYSEFKGLSENEQHQWIKEGGNLELDDYELNDTGDITDIKIEVSEND